MRTRLIAPVMCALMVLVVVGCSEDPANTADSIAGAADSRRALGFDLLSSTMPCTRETIFLPTLMASG